MTLDELIAALQNARLAGTHGDTEVFIHNVFEGDLLSVEGVEADEEHVSVTCYFSYPQWGGGEE